MSDTSTETKLKPEVRVGKNVPLPKKNYVIRCIEEEYKESSKGNFMIEREWEIVEPAQVEYPDKIVVTAGNTMRQYLTCVVKLPDGGKDERKTANCMALVRADYTNLGFDTDVDEDNPLAKNQAKGMLADAICNSKEYIQCEDLTPEQRAKGNRQGTPIVDRNTGKPIKGYIAQIVKIVGASSFVPTQPC
jgi:hypothetical protein